MDLGLEGKVALVTGGSKGIGEAITRTLLAEGALVALGYKPQEASKMLMKVADQCSTPEEMIRIALRNTMGGK